MEIVVSGGDGGGGTDGGGVGSGIRSDGGGESDVQVVATAPPALFFIAYTNNPKIDIPE